MLLSFILIFNKNNTIVIELNNTIVIELKIFTNRAACKLKYL